MNPFEKKTISRPGTYKHFVEKIICRLDIGESVKVEISKSELVKFRMSAFKIGEEVNMKFKTAVSVDDEFWVKRVA